MGKVLKAKYDAAQNALRLVEPLEGVKDEETVTVTVMSPVGQSPSDRPRLSAEAGEELSRLVNEMFPPWND